MELRIFQTDPGCDVQRDITFAYNANFFLYATLDTARPIAQVRGSTQPSNFPVLTGVPVAAIAYLDRPEQAGYFIFPDLSVRHEGQYRLSFSLYEELKEKEDADKGAPLQFAKRPASTPLKPTAPYDFLDFRLEVKSEAFTVYSAKKFPGLTTSTILSRVVAEQGCRVRIRRDVRMRRRGEKGGKDYSEYDSEHPYGGSPRLGTPDGYCPPAIERPRSTSNSTLPDAPYVTGPEVHRRQSATEYGYGQLPPPPPFHHPSPVPATGIPATPPPPPTSINVSDNHSHLCFGTTAPPQYPTPQLPNVHQTTQPTPYPTSLAHTRHSSNGSEPDAASFTYLSQPSSLRTAEEKTSFGRPALPPLLMDPNHVDNMKSFEHPSSVRHQHSGGLTLPPLKDLMRAEMEGMGSSSVLRRPRQYDTESHLSTKRTHKETFGDQREGPLFNGNRPEPNAHELVNQSICNSTDGPHGEGRMEYRRANGTYVTKFRHEN